MTNIQDDMMELRKLALAQHWGCDVDDITEGYTDGLFDIGRDRQFYVLQPHEIVAVVTPQIEELLWAFTAEWLVEFLGLPWEAADMLRVFQEEKCEGANDTIRALVDKTGGMDAFVRAAINEDGAAHFLASYDGDEIEVSVEGYFDSDDEAYRATNEPGGFDFLIYRVN